MLLKAITQEILRRPNTRHPRHWFVLDEFRAMERVTCIHDLLNRGRSKGASVLLGIQSVEGMLEIYGEHGANDLLSQCAHKTFLRAGGPKTGEWAEKYFGSVRRMEMETTEGGGQRPGSKSIRRHLQERPVFLSSFFMDLPFPGIGKPYVAVCDVPHLRKTIVVQRESDEILSWCKPPKKNISNVESRQHDKRQSLDPWTKEEELSFALKPASKSKSGRKGQRTKSDDEPQEARVNPRDRPDLKH